MTTSDCASNGGETTAEQTVKPKRGMIFLREKEAQALIDLVRDAFSEAYGLAHEMHRVIHRNEMPENSYEELSRKRDEALTCLSTGEHYLLMLGGVLDDQAGVGADPWAERAPYPVYMTPREASDGC